MKRWIFAFLAVSCSAVVLWIGMSDAGGSSKDKIRFALYKAERTTDAEGRRTLVQGDRVLNEADTASYRWNGSELKITEKTLFDVLNGHKMKQGFVLAIEGKPGYYFELWSLLSSAIPDPETITVYSVFNADSAGEVTVYSKDMFAKALQERKRLLE